MILWLFLKKKMKNCMIMENFEKNDLLQIVSIKILITVNFMLISMQKSAFDFNH